MLKIKVVYVLLIVECILFFSGCASDQNVTKAPLWVMEPDTVYPGEIYLNGVGEGSDRRTAESQAIAALGRSILQTVQTAARASQQFDAVDETISVQNSFESTVYTSSRIDDIAGARIKEIWIDADGRVYALAQLNRDESGHLYKSRIDKNTAVINSQIQFADSKGVSFESLMALRQAVVLAEQNRVYMSVLAGINNNLYRIVDLPYVSAGAVRTLMQRMQEELPVAVSVSGDPSERISTALSTVFAGIGLKTIEDVASAPLILAADFLVVPIEGGTKYKYVRFVLNVSLTEQSTGKELLSFSRNGREAHVTQNEAKERAIRTAEELITSELSKALKNLQLSAE